MLSEIRVQARGSVTLDDFVFNFRRKMNDIYDRVRTHVESDRMKDLYHIRAHEGELQIGELVWLNNPQWRRSFIAYKDN